MNALDLLKAREGPPFISFGCPLLDKSIGGVPFQGITELSGEAGCGKTQFCLSLALQVQLDALHGGRSGASAYLSCGEGTFPIRRLSQLASAYQQRTGIHSQDFLRNVHIEHCYNIEDAQSILRHKIPELCQQQNVKLLIIDSLAGLVRFEFDSSSTSDMRVRTVLLFQLAKELKLLSDIFKLSIVVVNQVKADMGEFASTSTSSSSHIMMGDSASMPALGMAWSYCVNTKISLHRNSAALRVVSTVVDANNDGSDEESEGRLLGSTDKPDLNQSASTGAGVVGQKRSIHDTVYSSHHYGKHADFCYDTAAESAGKHTAELMLHNTNLISNTINTSTASVTSNDPSTNKENTSSNKLTNTYTSHNILPKLHEYITYYPIQPNNNSSCINSADNNAYVPTDVPLSGKSTRYIRLDSSVYKARDSCRYEISHMGVFGIDE